MNIIRKEKERHTFDEVEVGGIFEYCAGIYIRIGDIVPNNLIYNAVCIEDGVVAHFMNNDVIYFVDADLVIH